MDLVLWIHRRMTAFARALAVLGGVVLFLLILLTCISIAGRGLNTLLHAGFVQELMPRVARALLDAGVGPVDGDFEIVQAGIAATIFAFLPWAQITGGHATVDLLTMRLPERVQRVLMALWEVVFALILVIIARQLEIGMQSKIRTGQTTFILQFPLWWGYAASLVGAVAAALVAIWSAFIRVLEAIGGRPVATEHIGEI